MERRTLIRLLIVLGIGIPVTIEAATFLGLVGQQLEDGDGTEADDGGTPAPRRVGVGDELLPETTPVERVTDMTIRATGGVWRFELVVEVRNELDTAYELRLGAVSTEGGGTVDGEATTGTMASGETTTVTGRWDLPEGETPDAVAVTAVVATPGEETPRELSRRVALARVPVRGS